MDAIQFLSSGLCPDCTECANDFGISVEDFNLAYENGSIESEPSFSSWPCELCHSHLGGDRYAAHGINTGELIHLEICTDCVLELAGYVYDKEFDTWN
jgi:hypothetical protein